MNLSNVSTQDLKKELAKRGYQTNNLWQLEDINQAIENANEDRKNPIIMSEPAKMEFLIEIMSSDGVQQSINEVISDQLYEMFPEEDTDN